LWRWDPAAERWTADFADPQWTELCTKTGLDAFEEAFGRVCLVHRSGDRFLSAAMLSCLAARGVLVDLTVEPGNRPSRALEHTRGLTPDYRRIPITPYRSSPTAFPAPDPSSESDPMLVPHLSAPGRRRPFRRHTLGPETQPVVFASRLALERLRHRVPVIALASRTDSALGPRWDALVRNLKHLTRGDRIHFATASEALEHLNGASDPEL
jgi:hypothetical protein